MRRILVGILSCLIIIFTIFCIINGVNFFLFHIPGIKNIKVADKELNEKIKLAEEENKKYEQIQETLKRNGEYLEKAKKEYLDLVTISTDSQIKKATQIKTYSIEYLWSVVGNHATKEGVNIQMDIKNASGVNNQMEYVGNTNEYKDLYFKATGNYLAITNFLSAIENDESLDFTIDQYNMTYKKCDFVVKDIKIKHEETSNIKSEHTIQLNKQEEEKAKKEAKNNTNKNVNKVENKITNTTSNTVNNSTNTINK